jgi:hypothetical protein
VVLKKTPLLTLVPLNVIVALALRLLLPKTRSEPAATVTVPALPAAMPPSNIATELRPVSMKSAPPVMANAPVTVNTSTLLFSNSVTLAPVIETEFTVTGALPRFGATVTV